MINSAPASAVKGICSGLIKGQCQVGDLAGQDIHRRLVRLSDGKAVQHVVGGQAQVQRLAGRGVNDIRRPAAAFGDLRMDERRAHPERQRERDDPEAEYRYQEAGEEFRAFHINSQSMMSVAVRQYSVTGMADAADLCDVRADQTSPPTSASVCAGAISKVTFLSLTRSSMGAVWA